MNTLDIGGRSLSFLRRGSGEPLLLVMGMGGHHNTWGEPLLSLLEQHFDVVAFDQRGVGESSDVEGPFTIADLADDAAALLDGLGWTDAHVFGISLGGMVAQELALRHPQRVRRLVLGCTYCGGPGATLDAPGPMRMLEGLNSGDPETAVRAAFLANLSPSWTADESHWTPFLQSALSVPVPVTLVMRQAQAAFGHDTSSRLPELSVPTLVVAGTLDEMIRPSNAELITSLIPDATLELLDGVGHLYWWELPERSAASIVEHCLGPVAG